MSSFKRVKSEGLSRDKVKLFVSYKQGFHLEISLPTISSWIKKTVVMCYDLAISEDLNLAKVKAHYVRALAASQAFITIPLLNLCCKLAHGHATTRFLFSI